MASKNDDRLKTIRENAAALRRPDLAATPEAEETAASQGAITSHFGIMALDTVTAGRAVQQISVKLIAPDLRPAFRQPRLLPLPEELLREGEVPPAHTALMGELRDLGASLQERQIQPIIVYPGASEHYTAASYLILIGHRRWLAATTAGIAALDAIVVDPPSPAERVQVQYAENEDRADFTDMERAWALLQMKDALGDAPWEEVERRFRLSSTRRHELTRLLAFTNAQQQAIAQLRLRENQIEPLHRAVRAGELRPDQVDTVLGQIRERSIALASSGDRVAASVDLTTIGRLLAGVRRAEATPSARAPQWLPPLRDKLARTAKDLKRLHPRMAELSDEERAALHRDIVALIEALEAATGSFDIS
ncbi:ParB/RepB/Spo0J family partition protein [Oscillochloris sp. ZM17-4]|uniref:ParB/RepB/Spo0J family partition protein n=1 Tax=Oscillochloris sp. ZM17-4 TaxID=2866714 RepID=UPI001C73987B|nr:ParB/RepB/Spo0J family partition protein [Oscillochloris sp. ZM17-4]MBX0329906.1 ParB/RepB/Spo0J family partition protein [Oscillochloris sp. ZM17-4]